MPPRFGDYMKATSGGTNAAASSSYGSTSNQGGGPAGMTFNEAANAGIMSQQEAQQAQQAINQQASQSGQGSTTDTAAQIRARKEKEEAESLAAKGKDIAQGIMTNLMGGGEGGNLSLTKKEAYAKLPAGMHPQRKFYEYLKEKYGPNWLNTTQAKSIEGYLSGVPVERGGGLGAQDKNYGLTGDEAEEFQSKLLLSDKFMDAENYRQRVLNQFSGKLGTIGSDFVSSDFIKNLDTKRLREGLTPQQFFNFNQQLMAADPTAGNQTYKDARPFSSGAGLGALAERFMPGATAISSFAGGLFPERDLTGYQQNIDPIAAGFRALPDRKDEMGEYYRDMERMAQGPGFMPIIPLPDPSQPPTYPFPVKPPFMPDGGNFPFPVGITSVFDPKFIGPSFRGSPYTNKGVSPAFYEALRRFS